MSDLTKEETELFLKTYTVNLDETEAALAVLHFRNPDIKIDDRVAGVLGRELLREKKIDKKVNEHILKQRITPEQLKIDTYKLTRADDSFGKGRTKLGALTLLGKWMGLEQPAINNFSVNLTWASLVENAHRQVRLKEFEKGENVVPAITE